MFHLNIGDAAPHFSAKDQNGEMISLDDFKGQKLILFFYPKDNTPTCTVEACNLRDNFEDLRKEGYAILGVSPDSEKRHQNFISKFELPYSLLADTDQEVMKSYGVWGPKKFMGKEFIGVHRTTYIIDEEGIISNIIKKVKAKVHTDQIREAATT